MSNRTASEPSLSETGVNGIHCCTEWHLRANPRAAVIYSMALHVTNGGQRPFYMSKPKIAKFLGWSRPCEVCKNLLRLALSGLTAMPAAQYRYVQFVHRREV